MKLLKYSFLLVFLCSSLFSGTYSYDGNSVSERDVESIIDNYLKQGERKTSSLNKQLNSSKKYKPTKAGHLLITDRASGVLLNNSNTLSSKSYEIDYGAFSLTSIDSGILVVGKKSNKINRVKRKSLSTTKRSLSSKSPASVYSQQMKKIVIKKGDWLSKYAQQYYGDAGSYEKILAANPQITNVYDLEVGQTINIPLD